MPVISLHGASVAVGTIYCIGKNYADHAEEMARLENTRPESHSKENLQANARPSVHAGAAAGEASEPMVFSKPASSLIYSGGRIEIPKLDGKKISEALHYETELVVAIGKTAEYISPAESLGVVSGYAVGLDMTLRDRQSAAKRSGHPWLVSKGFRTSAVVSNFVGAEQVKDPHQLTLTLHKNGTRVQHGCTRDMIFKIDVLIAYLSAVFGLCAGDLIYTGTPAGVGPVHRGDTLEATLTQTIAAASISNKVLDPALGNASANALPPDEHHEPLSTLTAFVA